MNETKTHSSTRSTTVTDADTAAQFGPDFPAAASTPFVLGLAEVTCHDAVRSLLAEGEITVGTRAEVDHLAPTPVGRVLTAHAMLVEQAGRRLTFDVEVRDANEVVARIRHHRAIVDGGRMRERLTR